MYDPWVSLIIGAIAGVIYILGDKVLIRFGIDDPINASPGESTNQLAVTMARMHVSDLLAGTRRGHSSCPRSSVSCFFAVHLGGGFWGSLARPLFDRHEGVFYQGSTRSLKFLGWNVLGAVVIFCWTFAFCFVMFYIMRTLKMLRVPREFEIRGEGFIQLLDIK